jgi:hypothetical protein
MVQVIEHDNIPIIYGWIYESNQSLLKVLSLIEGLRRGNNIPEVYVHRTKDIWNGIKNSFKENEFVISDKKSDKYPGFYDGGHHRIIAYHILDYDFNLKIIEPKDYQIPFSDLKEICKKAILSINQQHIFGYNNLLRKDKKFIDIVDVKEYKDIITYVEKNFGDKVDIKSFKEIVRCYINL